MAEYETLYAELEIHLNSNSLEFDIDDFNLYDYIGCCIDAITSINSDNDEFEIIYPNGDSKLPYEVIDDFDLFEFIKSIDVDYDIDSYKNSLENHLFINCLEDEEELTRLIKNYISMLTNEEVIDELQ